MNVASIFETFCNDLLIGTELRATISSRYLAICSRLNKDFWNMETTTGGRYVGSFGRNTANSWVSDIDMVFELPWATYNQYSSYQGNGQSSLLQTVKNSIAKTYSGTSLSGDGQIVKISFADSTTFEVLPVFKNNDDSYTFADSNSGGSWKKTNPIPEISAISTGDSLTNNNLRPLCRMARSWKSNCNVPINGLLIDILAYRFLTSWSNRDKSYLFYDWMGRDYFEYLKNQFENQTLWYAIGSNQPINNLENFRYKATQAYNRAVEAIKFQSEEKEWSAKQKWREVYGTRFPG
jgi:hypothetical protein